MTYSIRIGSDKILIANKFYEFKSWDDAERFARLYNVMETIQVKF